MITTQRAAEAYFSSAAALAAGVHLKIVDSGGGWL